MNGSIISALQEHMLEIIRAQQGAYLAAIRTWQQPGLSGLLPEAIEAEQEGSMMPSRAEVADATQAFTTRMVEDQRKFLADLNEVVGHQARTGRARNASGSRVHP